ncbi:MAG: RNA-binding cell elongation regulator Jag/EloR [Clostridia bacterium]|nr:RNA-binding cell elongation regulator Jag/EloR [Clostridia bacterium]MDY5231581.1 RNA-binding cell elongation regulator Jag/EloR [Eubacteriales bacterium]
MLKKIEKSAKNKEDALKLAAEEFGVAPEELSYTVERETGKGLMGLLLGKEVTISAWITKDAEEEEKIKKSALKRAAADETANGENPYAPKIEPLARDLAPDERKRKKKPAKTVKEPAKSVNYKENAEQSEQQPPKQPRRNREVTEESLKDAEFFATELIHKMGLTDAKLDVKNGGESIDIDVSGEKMGLLIGKRGDTLNAIQYLTSLYVNRSKNSYIKINIDTEGYRSKREETLVKLAKSLERRVIRDRESVSLEPMSPNERRIIHSALQDSDSVRTFSVGEEPNRKIVVALK